jgi:hypothetical protein
MTVPPALRILAVDAVSIAALVGLVVRESLARQAGTEVILRMEAADPRALLTGHYVSIALRETLAPGAPCPAGVGESAPSAPFGGERPPSWVALAQTADHASVAGVAPGRTQAQRLAPLVVRGSAWCTPSVAPSDGDPGQVGAVSLDLGVDRFHISQAEAERIEGLMASQRQSGGPSPVDAIVSIGQDGRARLKGLVVEGRRMELSLF